MSSKSLQVRQHDLKSKLGVGDTDLIAREPTDLTVQPAYSYALDEAEQIEGADKLSREDLQIPHLILVQAQHADIPNNLTHIGQWYNDLTGEFSWEVEAIVLSLVKGRIAFPRQFSRESKALCASDDGLFPRQDFVGVTIADDERQINWTIDGSACAQCPFSQFGENSETPLCAKAFSYAMIDVETGVPFIVRAQRTGMQAAKQLNTLAKILGRRKLIRLTSREVKSDTGAYFVPVFTTAEIAPDELKAYAQQTSQLWGNIAARAELPRQNGNGNGRNGAQSEPDMPIDPPDEEDVPF